MGRGRKRVIEQGNKIKKSCGSLPKEDRKVFSSGIRTAANQTIVYLPEEVLNELKQLGPRDIVNILVNP